MVVFSKQLGIFGTMKIFLILFLFANSVLADASNIEPSVSKPPGQLQPYSAVIRDYLEMVSFGATIAIAISALFALKQIRLARLKLNIASDALVVAKDDIKIRSRREAIALAAKHCEDFADVILPRLHNWCAEFGSKLLEFYFR